MTTFPPKDSSEPQQRLNEFLAGKLSSEKTPKVKSLVLLFADKQVR